MVSQGSVHDNKILVASSDSRNDETVKGVVRDAISQVFEGRHGDWAIARNEE